MRALERPTLRILLYEGDGAASLQSVERFELMQALLGRGYGVTSTGTSSSRVDQLPEQHSMMIVLGRFDDGVTPNVEEASGQVHLVVIDIRDTELEQLVQLVEEELEKASLEVNRTAEPGKTWKPWFPVIDYDRCTNCMQCLSFCLFDVYGVDQGNQIQVQNNDNCKTDCPACSRVCPEVAIMFPKYKAGPINGDIVTENDVKREAMKVNISDLLGGDIYGRLRERSDEAKQRFAKERDDKRALSERMRCLTKMQGKLEIPVSALKDLPSVEEIRERAEAATAKAKAAIERNES